MKGLTIKKKSMLRGKKKLVESKIEEAVTFDVILTKLSLAHQATNGCKFSSYLFLYMSEVNIRELMWCTDKEF